MQSTKNNTLVAQGRKYTPFGARKIEGAGGIEPTGVGPGQGGTMKGNVVGFLIYRGYDMHGTTPVTSSSNLIAVRCNK